MSLVGFTDATPEVGVLADVLVWVGGFHDGYPRAPAHAGSAGCWTGWFDCVRAMPQTCCEKAWSICP